MDAAWKFRPCGNIRGDTQRRKMIILPGDVCDFVGPNRPSHFLYCNVDVFLAARARVFCFCQSLCGTGQPVQFFFCQSLSGTDSVDS
uniref:Uncharacterized protein n=1 Tax=Aegilops tauschii subsp. strangulata TaxID=200361 RepID=A0A453GMU5_AEGTS